jgi:2-polyprenyl-3-methyl-5-hydroxy-6-metoxy-1,4-benzoquinol methylase
LWRLVDQEHIGAISDHLFGNKILDKGCGSGTTTAHVSKMGHPWTELIITSRPLDIAEKKFSEQFLDCKCIPITF